MKTFLKAVGAVALMCAVSTLLCVGLVWYLDATPSVDFAVDTGKAVGFIGTLDGVSVELHGEEAREAFERHIAQTGFLQGGYFSNTVGPEETYLASVSARKSS